MALIIRQIKFFFFLRLDVINISRRVVFMNPSFTGMIRSRQWFDKPFIIVTLNQIHNY